MIPKKKQALVEFDDIESAKNLVESSQVCAPSLMCTHIESIGTKKWDLLKNETVLYCLSGVEIYCTVER